MSRYIFTGLINGMSWPYAKLCDWQIINLKNIYDYSKACNATLEVMTKDRVSESCNLFKEFAGMDDWACSTMTSWQSVLYAARHFNDDDEILWIDLDLVPNTIQDWPGPPNFINFSVHPVDNHGFTGYDKGKVDFFNNVVNKGQNDIFKKVKSCIFMFTGKKCREIEKYFFDDRLFHISDIRKWIDEGNASPNDEHFFEAYMSLGDSEDIHDQYLYSDVIDGRYDTNAPFVHFGSNTKNLILDFKEWKRN